jgi:hypothetical protein
MTLAVLPPPDPDETGFFMNTEDLKKTTSAPTSPTRNALMTLAILGGFGALGGLLWVAETMISGR